LLSVHRVILDVRMEGSKKHEREELLSFSHNFYHANPLRDGWSFPVHVNNFCIRSYTEWED
jgi:hypothetical protein